MKVGCCIGDIAVVIPIVMRNRIQWSWAEIIVVDQLESESTSMSVPSPKNLAEGIKFMI